MTYQHDSFARPGYRGKFLFITLFWPLLIAAFSSPCFAGWLIYSKPEFKGKVIDTETKQPIEGAVVVAIYNKDPIISGPAGGSSSIIHIKETLTDEKGDFHIPAYTTLMGPNSTEGVTNFIIYKPGYGSGSSLSSIPTPHVRRELLFSKEIGTKGEIQLQAKTVLFTYGIVELPRVNTWEQRRKVIPGIPSEITSKEIPLLNEIIENETDWLWKNRGWGNNGDVYDIMFYVSC